MHHEREDYVFEMTLRVKCQSRCFEGNCKHANDVGINVCFLSVEYKVKMSGH